MRADHPPTREETEECLRVFVTATQAHDSDTANAILQDYLGTDNRTSWFRLNALATVGAIHTAYEVKQVLGEVPAGAYAALQAAPGIDPAHLAAFRMITAVLNGDQDASSDVLVAHGRQRPLDVVNVLTALIGLYRGLNREGTAT